MPKKIFIIALMCFGLIVLFPPLSQNDSFIPTFRVSENPVAITRGSNGSALTINIAFGDKEIANWIDELQKPYPFLFIDMDWASRFPKTIQLINEKNIPTGLLGNDGSAYEQDATLLLKQLDQYEKHFGMKPLWFRTADEDFPVFLRNLLVEVQVNALGSSLQWNGGDIPSSSEGEIISIPHYQGNHISLLELRRLFDSREFQSVEDVIFGISVKTKKTPH
ncbi:hypothetical protein ACXYMX_04860 [Sporosarcina sp. CAU 1771]